MAISDLAYIRLVLSLPHRVVLVEEMGVGDGARKKFKSQLAPIIDESDSVRLDGAVQTRDTHYSIDNDLGLFTFVAAPPSDQAVSADYTWAVFSDIQINGLLTKHNNAITAVLKDLVRALLSNTDLFIKYTEGMESVDRTAALGALQSLQQQLMAESSSAAGQAIVWKQDDVDSYGRDVQWKPFVSSTPED